MAVGTAGTEGALLRSNGTENYTLPMVSMVSLSTALSDILVPHFKDLFHLTSTVLPSCYCATRILFSSR
jgi:hypothetical protein